MKRKPKKKYKAGMKPSTRSKYGRKRAFLLANGGRGSDYPNKPWK